MRERLWTHLQPQADPLQGGAFDRRQQAGQRRHPGNGFAAFGAGLLQDRHQGLNLGGQSPEETTPLPTRDHKGRTLNTNKENQEVWKKGKASVKTSKCWNQKLKEKSETLK